MWIFKAHRLFDALQWGGIEIEDIKTRAEAMVEEMMMNQQEEEEEKKKNISSSNYVEVPLLAKVDGIHIWSELHSEILEVKSWSLAGWKNEWT